MAKIVGDFEFNLTSTDQLKLYDSEMKIVNSVAYSNSVKWSNQPDGLGTSLELNNTQDDNNLSKN